MNFRKKLLTFFFVNTHEPHLEFMPRYSVLLAGLQLPRKFALPIINSIYWYVLLMTICNLSVSLGVETDWDEFYAREYPREPLAGISYNLFKFSAEILYFNRDRTILMENKK